MNPCSGQSARVVKLLFGLLIVTCLIFLLIFWKAGIKSFFTNSKRRTGLTSTPFDFFSSHNDTLIAVPSSYIVTATKSVILNQILTTTINHYKTVYPPNVDGISEEAILDFTFHQFSQPQLKNDLYGLGLKFCLFAKLWNNLGGRLEKSTIDKVVVQSLFNLIENDLFSWIKPKFSSLIQLYQHTIQLPRGIVLTTGPEYFNLAVHTIRSIRMLGCELPIQVYHSSGEELTRQQIDLFSTMPNVKVIDMSSMFDNSKLSLRGWDLKPFAILASPYQETILMDADTVWLKNPEILFTDPGYIETGALYFPDRTLWFLDDRKQAEWLHKIYPSPIPTGIAQSRFYKNQTHYEIESGGVVMNKSKAFLGLLATCQINSPHERDIIHELTHGEKETFWLGFEMIRQPYSLMPTFAGSIGSLMVDEGKTRHVCGKLLHFDRTGDLLWFNDGITLDKHSNTSLPVLDQFAYYGTEGKWNMLCLSGDLKPVPENHKATLKRIVDLFVADPLTEFPAVLNATVVAGQNLTLTSSATIQIVT